MRKYIIKRLLQLIPVLIGITFLSFAMMRLAGGDAVTYMYENAGSAVSHQTFGADRPGEKDAVEKAENPAEKSDCRQEQGSGNQRMKSSHGRSPGRVCQKSI